MNLDTVPASNYPLPELVEFLNRGFEAYFVPIQFDTLTFLNMLRQDGIDLTASRVLLADDQPCGIALIARRGWCSRLAAMGIVRESRGRGAGTWFMDELIHEAHQRGEREMVLEVIEQNEPAVKLYEKSGFRTVRRLVGFIRNPMREAGKSALAEIDLRELGRLIARHGLPDLPWQLSGESVAEMNPPARAYCQDQAYLAISDPSAEHVVICSLLVEQQARGRGRGTAILQSLAAHHPDKTWHVPAIFPEEFEKVFARTGFERDELSQWQMSLSL
jgi:ribosomal protein S18 acetylase RimI-like enzyme